MLLSLNNSVNIAVLVCHSMYALESFNWQDPEEDIANTTCRADNVGDVVHPYD